MPSVQATLIVLVVVPRDGRYLVVEERDGTFFLPAGRVEPGETLLAAAVRETEEEAGVTVLPQAFLGLDQYWTAPSRTALRFAFVARPPSAAGAASPKSIPDHHSRGARWVTKDELRRLPLRHPEVLAWIERYEAGGALLPCAAYACAG